MLLQVVLVIVGVMLFKNTTDALENVDELCRNEETGFRMPHPEKCNLYLECTNNNNDIRAMMFTCDNDVFFNPITLKCDSLYSSEQCKKSETVKTTAIDFETTISGIEDDKSTVTISNIETTTVISTTTPESPTNDPTIITCPSVDFDQVLFIKSVEDCSKYFMCYHGKPLPLQCWSGLYWNDKMKKCTPAELSECEANLYPFPQCPSQGYAFLPHPEKCQYFLYCQHGIKTVQRCGSFDYWDINEKKCKRKSNATCYSDIINKLKN